MFFNLWKAERFERKIIKLRVSMNIDIKIFLRFSADLVRHVQTLDTLQKVSGEKFMRIDMKTAPTIRASSSHALYH